LASPTAVMFHRSLYQDFGRINPNLINTCDLEYWLRVGVNCGIAYIPEILASYRVHPKAASTLNQSERRYRTYVLDPALLFHEFVFHPAFAPLRAAAGGRHPAHRLTGSIRTAGSLGTEVCDLEGTCCDPAIKRWGEAGERPR
jgi:hypothetical protein